MKISLFLANRIRNSKGQSFSRIIVKVGVLSVAIAVAVITLSFFVLFGFKNTIKEKLFSLTSHLQISKITLNHSFEETPIAFNEELFHQGQAIPEIKSINKVALKSVILKSQNEIGGVVLKGVDTQYDWSEFKNNIIEGNTLSPDSSNQIIISKRIAGVLDVRLGEDLTAYFVQDPPRARKLKVVGIYDSKVGDIDKLYAITSLNLISQINGWNEGQFGHYEIFLKDIDKMTAVKENLNEIFANEYNIRTATELMPNFFEWFKFLDRNIVLIIALIMIVASFNMISVLLIMIMERTPMVGLLKSLGAQMQQIRAVFLVNSSRIIFYGLLTGNLIVIVFAYIQWRYRVLKLDSENYYMDYVPIAWDWITLLLINIGVFLCVLVITILPTIIVNRIDPVKALKYKD